MGYWTQYNDHVHEQNMADAQYEPKRQAFLAKQAADRQAQNNFMLQNRQQQEQQGFENEGVLRTRSLDDQAREAARTGNIDAIRYIQSQAQEQNQQEGSMTGPDGKPAKLRAGEIPITSGFSSGASPSFSPNNSGSPQPTLTLQRAATSLLQQNPALANNPEAFFAALDKVKSIMVPSDQQRLDQLRFQQQKELQTMKDKAAMERKQVGGGNVGGFNLQAEAYNEAKRNGKSEQEAIQAALAVKRAQSGEVTANTTAKKEAELGVKREGEAPKARNMMEDTLSGVDSALTFIDQAKDKASSWNTGMGANLAALKGSDAYDLARIVDTVKSNIGFDKLQQMKADSPTGSALGRVTNQEITMLTNVVASLDPGQTKEQFITHLDIAKKALASSKERIKQAYYDTYGNVKGGGDRQPAPESAGGLPPGWSVQVGQ